MAPPMAVCGRLPAWHCCVPWGRAPPCTCLARLTGRAVTVAKHAAAMLACFRDLSRTTLGSVPCVSLYKGHTNPLDGLKTPNEVTKVLDGVHTPIQPDTRLQQGCSGGEDRGTAERERADSESKRRNQVSYPGRQDRPQSRQPRQTRR